MHGEKDFKNRNSAKVRQEKVVLRRIRAIDKEIRSGSFPNTNEVSDIIADYEKSYNILIDKSVRNELVISFKGLTEFEIRQILNYAYQQSGMFDKESVKKGFKRKRTNNKKKWNY